MARLSRDCLPGSCQVQPEAHSWELASSNGMCKCVRNEWQRCRGGRGGYSGGHNGKSTPNAKWVEDGADSSEKENSEKGSPVGAYTANESPPAGYKRGPCNNCGKYEHLARECRGEATDTVAQYWNEEGDKSPGRRTHDTIRQLSRLYNSLHDDIASDANDNVNSVVDKTVKHVRISKYVRR